MLNTVIFSPERNRNFNQIAFRETQTNIELPVYVKYTYEKPINAPILQALQPFGYLGFTTSYMFNAELSDVSRSVVNDFSAPSSSSPPVDLFAEGTHPSQRERLNFAATIGAGFKYRVGRINYLFVDFRYNRGLTNFVNTEARFDNNNPDLRDNLLYVDDDLALNSFMVMFGFTKSFYRTKFLGSTPPAKGKKSSKRKNKTR